ncbi:Multidrug resistance protein MdtB [Xanthomonas sacchari]|uniref:Efflux RND transporter permease subunit n=1 Tax=Xanthomonas sacchari TaxID=56458 RepID=A0AA46Q5X0_9XANT|nr:efflux RND transporter permease subunit [Xanthomonas sacchari]MCW0367986.1 Multidrug resistance protein MdtB [Xanthomonas sacchari]MCW0442144.1 Multidrug resistance protein MdtB [Xanthomonas sacchari]UYK87668.1 efflux RND transporter permease subunit [Xanthomonas sacchari]
MNLSALFIRRAVMTSVLMIALVLAGGMAYFALPVSELPDVSFPTITVNMSLPGANPETMAAAVATPLERQFSGLPGLDTMSSTSSVGSTRIVLQFALSRNVDAAAQDVQNAVSQAAGLLPREINPAQIQKEDPSAAPIMHLILRSKTIALPLLNQFAKDRVALRLASVPGAGQIDVNGAQKYAVRLFVNPHLLAARHLGFDQVVSAVQAGNSNAPAGTLMGRARSYTVRADGQLKRAADFDAMVLSYADGAPVRLRDVGHAEDSVENLQTAASLNGQRAIEINIHRQPGANTLSVTQGIQAALPGIRAQLPGDAQLDVLYDRGDYIGASVEDVEWTLVGSLVLVIVVILLFLRSWMATLIVALVLPTSLIGTFAVMRLLHFSLDNISMLALTLSVGFVVDDAIVVIENIVRHAEQGASRMDAAIAASREIGFTVLSMTVSLSAVFLPIVFMGGLVGRLFSEFGMVIAIAVILSGIVSLTLTPMLASRWLDPKKSAGWVFERFDRLVEASERGYARSLAWATERIGLMCVIGVATLVGTAGVYAVVEKGFIPQVDSGKIDGDTRVPEGTAFADFVAKQAAVVKIIQRNPNVANVESVIGSDNSLSNSGRLLIGLKPLSERSGSAEEVIQDVRKQVATIQGITLNMRNPPAIDMGPTASNGSLQYVLQSTDQKALYAQSDTILQRLRQLRDVQDPQSDLQLKNPEIEVVLHREQAAALGVTAAGLQDTLASAYGGRKISTIYGDTDQYEVLLQVDPAAQADLNGLDALSFNGNQNPGITAIGTQTSNSSSGTSAVLTAAGGPMVPLRAVADVRMGVGPVAINHYAGLPAVTLSMNLAPGVSLGEAAAGIGNLMAQTLGKDDARAISGQFAGSAQAFENSMKTLPMLLLITVLLIYGVLAILYENALHPITILTSLPLAGFGAILMLVLFRQELNLFSFVGLILLVGLVKKNGIMMVDYALDLERSGDARWQQPRAAMLEAATVRFRPIMMTTLAAVLGSLPIALGFGAGAEARRPLGIAVVGGLLFSQALTLYLTPAFHIAMAEWLARRRARRNGAAPPSAPTLPEPA